MSKKVPETHVNLLVDQTLKVKFNQLMCKKFGCLTVGDYYHLPQSHCRRCGKITRHAASHCKPWEEPREDYLTWL